MADFDYFNIYYHYDFGFCVAFYNDKESMQCFFEDGVVRLINGENNKDLLSLSSHSVNYRKIIEFEHYSREIEYDEANIKISIMPTSRERQTLDIRVEEGDRRYAIADIMRAKNCNCGSRNCRHIGYAESYLNKRLRDLATLFIHSDMDAPRKFFVENEYYEKLYNFSYSRSPYIPLSELNRIRELILLKDHFDYQHTCVKMIIRIDDYYYEADKIFGYIGVFYSLFLDESFYKNFVESELYLEYPIYYDRQFKSNMTVLKKAVKAFISMKKEIDKGNFIENGDPYKQKLLYLYVKQDYALTIKYFSTRDCDWDDIDEIVLSSVRDNINGVSFDEKDLIQLLLYLDQSNLKKRDELFIDLSKHLSHDGLLKVLSKAQNVKVDLKQVASFSKSDQKQLLKSLDPSRDTLDLAMNQLLDNDYEKVDYVLSSVQALMKKYKDLPLLKEYVKSLEKIPNAILSYYYVKGKLTFNNYDKYLSKDYDIESEIKALFNVDYFFVESGEKLVIHYVVSDKYSQEIIIRVIQNQDTLSLDIVPEEFEDPLDLEQIKRICISNKQNEYNDKLQKQKEKISKLIFSKNHAPFTKDMQNLCSILSDDNQIIFNQENKVKIEYSFYLQKNSVSLSFRIGNTKLYQIKNILEFFEAFDNRQTITYGKDLVLTHDTANLTPRDADIMRLFAGAVYKYGKAGDPKNKRYITITSSLCLSILDKLHGSTFYFDDELYTLENESITLSANISSKYKLETSLKSNQRLVVIANTGFVLTTTESRNYINKLSNLADEVHLLEFFSKHGSTSIEPIVDSFKREVYAKFASFITLDSKIKSKFKLSNLNINIYFDYNANVVDYRVEYEKDGVKLKNDSILDQFDHDKVNRLEQYLSYLGFENRKLISREKILSFFRMDFTHLRSLSTVYLSDSISRMQIVNVSRQVIKINYNSGLIELVLEKSEFSEDELAQILTGIRLKKHFIVLKGNRIVDLDDQDAEDFGQTVQDFNLDVNTLYQRKTIPMTTAIKAFAHQKNCHVDKYLRDMIEDLRGFKTADIPLPKVKATLRGYQIEGFNWLSILSSYNLGGILADDMGLGKTLQIITLLRSNNEKKPSLIVCPKSLIFNWKSEFTRFDPKSEVVEIYGVESARRKIISSINYSKRVIYITNYDSLRSDAQHYTGQFNFCVLDEAQYIKNVYALKTKSVKSIDAVHRFALTGTPIENSIVDLWSIFDFIMPGYLEEINSFKSSDTDSIKRKVTPFILRRTKENVLKDLPMKYQRIISCEMDNEQKKLYEATKEAARKALQGGGTSFDILPYLTRLRQICISPNMFVENYSGESCKIDLLKSLILEYIEKNHRILVFSQFVKALNHVETLLSSLNIKYYLLTGDTSAKDRINMMNTFNEDEEMKVFLISLKAGGTGLNLTGADTVIHLDPWWNVAAEDQADDRTHRIGQKRNVEIIKLIAQDSIEQRVIELQEMKKDIIDKVINNDDSLISKVTLEDISFILK